MANEAPTYPTQYEDAEDEIDLARLWGLLWSGKWKIINITVAAVVCALFYLFVVQPTYRADGLLQIQPENSSSALDGLTSDLQQLTGKNTSPAQGEMQIIKSRSVLGQAVDKLQLGMSIRPHYFPVIGQAIAERRKATESIAQAVPVEQGTWLSHYAWRPASARVTRLIIPKSLYGEEFTLRALGAGRYVLFGPKHEKILTGQVGQAASGKTPQGEDVHLFVAKLTAGSVPTDFVLEKRSWLPVVQALQSKLGISEQGDNTGVVRLSLEGEDRSRITKIINTISTIYLRQNVEARSKQAEKSLEFLQKQLPKLRKDVEAADTKLADYREKNQASDLDAQGQALLDQVVNLEDKRSQLESKMAELRETYTGDYPELKVAKDQMQQFGEERKQLQSRINQLPGAQKQILSLRRDVEVNTQLYTALLNRAQELRVVKAGTVGNVRIIDKAVEPVRSVAPNSALVLLLSIVLGGILGCCVVFLQAALRRGVSDPREIENKLGLPVYAVIPFSPWLARNSKRAHRQNDQSPLLARDHSDDVTVEAIRSLRTSLYFAQMESGGNIVLMTGPAPGVGKSFVSANLAYLLADVDKKVVVVDADMRKGRLHEFLDHNREPGLSQILTGEITAQQALRQVNGSGFHIITSGTLPPNPSELLMRESFHELLQTLKAEFDLVIIDAPPMLAVTDASVIAASTEGVVTFLVARAGQHPMAELEECVKRASRQGNKIAGVVFNGLKKEHAEYVGGYSYYQYEYKAKT